MADNPQVRRSGTPNSEAVFTQFRSSKEWKDWLQRFANSEGMEMAVLIDDALMRLARQRGFDPPPRR